MENEQYTNINSSENEYSPRKLMKEPLARKSIIGAGIGWTAQTAATRYMLFPSQEDPVTEALAWGLSGVLSTCLPVGVVTGIAGGMAATIGGIIVNKEKQRFYSKLESKDNETLERYNSRLEPSGFVDNIKYNLSPERRRKHDNVKSILENTVGDVE